MKSLVIIALSLSFSLHAQVNLDSGLVGCYPFSGNANDMSGHRNNGVVYGATLTTDRFGNPNSAYEFNGYNYQYVDIPNFGTMVPNNELSISIWTQQSEATSTCPVVLIADSEKNRICGCIQYEAALDIWDYGNILGGGRMTYGVSTASTAWQHWVFIVSESQNIKEMYMNGVLLSSSTYTGLNIKKAGRTLSLGGSFDWSGGGLWWFGGLDDVRIYNRALTQAEVTMLYTSPPPCAPVISTKVTCTPTCSNCKGTAFAQVSDTTAKYSYKWSNGDTGKYVTNLCPGTYSVNVYDSSGTDVSWSSVNIGTLPGPAVTINVSSLTINFGSSTTLSAMPTGGSKPYSYIWNGSDTNQVITVTPLVNTTYIVIVTDSNGCATSAETTIDVTCGNVFVPDAFSPNGDGANDVLYVRGDCIKSMDFIVYDRWGNKMFESNNPSMGWNGTFKGQPMNTGTYVYLLNAEMYNGTSYSKKGNVALVR